ncbi:MAG: hypothetical protein GX033_08995 [Firmicutes bacterium]|nr:hypothetical protein [Bacillota bacterium]
MVIILGGASLSLAIFYPKRARERIQKDKTIKNKRRVIRFLRTKLAFNGSLLILLGVMLWTRWVPEYVIGIVASILVLYSYYTERKQRRGKQ